MRKVFFFLFTLFFSFLITTAPVFAEKQPQNVTVNKDQVINGDYFAGGDTVTVLGTVNGDAYVAGGTVTFDGTINGDIIVGGGTVTINGTAQNVRVAGGTITINGTIERNLTALGGTITLGENAKLTGSIVTAGGTITLLAPVGKGATIAGGTVTISNTIGGDVYAGVGQMTLQPQAKINGNLNYTSDQKLQIIEGATVSGKISQTIPEKKQREQKEDVQKKTFLGLAGAALFFKLINMASMLILGLILIALAPVYVKRVAHGIANRPWLSLGVGVVALLLAPIIFIALLLTVIGIPLAFIFIVLFGILAYFAKLFVMYLIGEKIGTSINPRLHMAWFFIIGLIVYEVVVLIPILGWLIDLAALLFGLGSLLVQKKYLYNSLRKEKAI